TWLIFGLPLALALLLLLWAVLALQFARGQGNQGFTSDIVRAQYVALGPASYEQKAVFLISVLLAVLWITRADLVLGSFSVPGWERFFAYPAYFSDGTVAM